MASPAFTEERLSTDPSIPPADGSCPWDELANELKDHIFWFAYIPDHDVPVVDKDCWGCLHTDYFPFRVGCPRVHRRIKKFPDPYINSFLVSKSWLKAAWQLFLAYAMLSFGCRGPTEILNRFINIYDTRTTVRNVLTPWSHKITQVTVVLSTKPDGIFNELLQLPCLRHLRLRVLPSFFRIAKEVTGEILAAPHFQQLWAGWTVPRTLHVTVEGAQCTEDNKFCTHVGKCNGPTFLKNVETFECLLNIHIQQPRLEDKNIPETLEEVQNLLFLNRTGFLAFLREVKKERMARQLQPAEAVEGDQAGSR